MLGLGTLQQHVTDVARQVLCVCEEVRSHQHLYSTERFYFVTNEIMLYRYFETCWNLLIKIWQLLYVKSVMISDMIKKLILDLTQTFLAEIQASAEIEIFKWHNFYTQTYRSFFTAAPILHIIDHSRRSL